VKVEEFKHVSKADFRRTSASYKECYSAFASAASVVGGRDLIEEYLAAKVWPLTRDWLPGTFSKVRVAGLKDKLPFPDFGLRKSDEVSDDMIVEEIQQEAVAIAGPYLTKERDSFEAICSEKIRVNQSFFADGSCVRPSRSSSREEEGGEYFCALLKVCRGSGRQEVQKSRSCWDSSCEGSEGNC